MTIAIDELLEWFEQTPWLARAPRHVQRHYARLARECYARRGTRLEAPPDWRGQPLVWVVRSGQVRTLGLDDDAPPRDARAAPAAVRRGRSHTRWVHQWAAGDAFIWPAIAWPLADKDEPDGPTGDSVANAGPRRRSRDTAEADADAPLALEDSLLLAVPIVAAPGQPLTPDAASVHRPFGLGDVPTPWTIRASPDEADAPGFDGDSPSAFDDPLAAATAARWAKQASAAPEAPDTRIDRPSQTPESEDTTVVSLIRPLPIVSSASSLQRVAEIMQRERSGAILLGTPRHDGRATAEGTTLARPCDGDRRASDGTGYDVASPQRPVPWTAMAGIVTDRDLRRALAQGLAPSSPAAAVMSATLRTITPDTHRRDAVIDMLRYGVHHLPVVAPASSTGPSMRAPRLLGQVTAVTLGQAQATEALGLERDIASAPDVERLAALAPRLYDLYLALHRRRHPLDDIDTLLALVIRRFCERLAQLLDPATRDATLPAPPRRSTTGVWTLIGQLDLREPTPGRPPIWPRTAASCPIAAWLEALPDRPEQRLLPRPAAPPRHPRSHADPLRDGEQSHRGPEPVETPAPPLRAHNVTRLAWIVGTVDDAPDGVAQAPAIDLVTGLLDPIAEVARSCPQSSDTTPEASTAERLAHWARWAHDGAPALAHGLDALRETWNRTRRLLGLRALYGIPPTRPFPASAAPPDLRGVWNLALATLRPLAASTAAVPPGLARAATRGRNLDPADPAVSSPRATPHRRTRR